MVNANYIFIDGNFYAKNHPIAKAYAQSMGGLRDTIRKPDPIPALDSSPKKHRGRKRGVGICVKIISFRKRETDLDNVIYGAKGLRDSIAKSLAIDDNDSRVRWEYDTVTTTGARGTQVIISKL